MYICTLSSHLFCLKGCLRFHIFVLLLRANHIRRVQQMFGKNKNEFSHLVEKGAKIKLHCHVQIDDTEKPFVC